MNLAEVRDAYIDDGYGYEAASTRSCQDAFLTVVATSPFADKVTFKGGIVMQQVSGDRRRATQDIDFDFMCYSIADQSIRAFVEKLNSNKAGIRIRIDGPIEELKHQDYDGKRVHIAVSDKVGNSVKTKLDIGVHADLSIEQREICFDVMASDGAISLLGNTDEQMIAEKMRSLLRIGARSTRYKDVFDIYYHLRIKGIDTGFWTLAWAKASLVTSRCEKGIGPTCMRASKRSSRTGATPASFPEQRTIGSSFPQGRLRPESLPR